jgi:hypothetical protein
MKDYLPSGVRIINPRYQRHDDRQHGVAERATSALPPSWCWEESYVCPATCCSVLSPIRNSQTEWLTSWIGRMASIITHVISVWPVTGWRPAAAAWLIPLDSRKGNMSGCIARLGHGESPLSSSHNGMAPARWSPERRFSVQDLATSQGYDDGWCTWTDWQHV